MHSNTPQERTMTITEHFNLVDEPWIKVIDQDNQEKLVSLTDLFKNSRYYQHLAGETASQDVAILRLLLAFLTTIYSRYNANDQPYEWINIDKHTMKPIKFNTQLMSQTASQDLLETWRQLWQQNHFTQVAIDYLAIHYNEFNLYDLQQPFYQVTKKQFDQSVPEGKKINTGNGVVNFKQINRTISESSNKPNVFAPADQDHKNDYTNDSFARWLITYQNYTGKTDKTKVFAHKSSNAKGWLYQLNPVYAVGDNLFETLMLNLILIPQNAKLNVETINQQPVWEQNSQEYLQKRDHGELPTNLAELYTLWSRILYIDYSKNNKIYSAGLPDIDNEKYYIEPMTTWHENSKHKIVPNTRRIKDFSQTMWRNFGQYVTLNSDKTHQPGIVTWLRYLNHYQYLNPAIHLKTAGLIDDGISTSQRPIAEFKDNLQIKTKVLFDRDLSKQDSWPTFIEHMVELTNKVGTYLWFFGQNIAKLKDLSDTKPLANRIANRYYEMLNRPFRKWLIELNNDDDKADKQNTWKRQVMLISRKVMTDQLAQANSKERHGKLNSKNQLENVFTEYQKYYVMIKNELYPKKEGK